MLVLTRHVNQSVIITLGGQVVKVVLIDTPRDGKARLGFEADESVKVYREELYAQIQQERASGVQGGNCPGLDIHGGSQADHDAVPVASPDSLGLPHAPGVFAFGLFDAGDPSENDDQVGQR